MKFASRNIGLGIVAVGVMFVLSNIAYGVQDSDSVIITQSVANCNNDGVCDSYENYSICPNDCSAPTSTPPTTTSTTGGGGFTERFLVKFQISDVQIETDTNSVKIVVFTNKISSVYLEWGESMIYGNILLSRDLKIIHEFDIDNLEIDTPYYYRIEATSIDGETAEYKGAFRTKTVKKENIVLNVIDFKALARDKDIELVWQNPKSENFEGVRIVRSDKFFPTDPYAGKVVFEGSGDRYIDKDVEIGKMYFYTAFSYDKEGNFSSGVVAQAMVLKEPTKDVIVEEEEEVVESPTLYPPFNILDIIEESPIVSPEVEMLTLEDFDIVQKGHFIEPIKGRVILDIKRPFKIRIPYNKVPEVLKSIIVRIYKDKNRKEKISFLLRVDKKKTEYKAMVAPLEEVGVYDMEIYILDFKHRKLKLLKGNIIGVRQTGVKSGATEKVYDFRNMGVYVSILFLSMSLILIFYKIIKKVLIV